MWHFSEDQGIKRFAPHVPAGSMSEPFVWAVDTRHAPMFWFPRDCPRGCAWASSRTTSRDRSAFFGQTEATRIHVIEAAWLERVRVCTLFAYRLSGDSFEPHGEVGGYWVSRAEVEPFEVTAVGDLLALHADAGIELRIAPSIWPWWGAVVESTLEFSGSRLRNCTVPEPDWVRQRRA